MKEKIDALKSLVSAGLLKSTERLNKVSSFRWKVLEVSFELSRKDYESVCVYLISKNYDKLAFLLFIKKEDANKIFKIFSGYYLSESPEYKKSYELLISEIGNIMLNSVLSEIANRLSKIIIPDVPRTINGEKKFILENISGMLEENKSKVPLSATVLVESESDKLSIELYFFIENGVIEKI